LSLDLSLGPKFSENTRRFRVADGWHPPSTKPTSYKPLPITPRNTSATRQVAFCSHHREKGDADPVTIASAIPAVKTAFDTLRAAIGLVKDTKDLLPKDEKAVAITAALATAESSAKVAEAEVAKALGYELCKCTFPPTIMLTVGEHNGRNELGVGPVYECPRCGYNTAGPYLYKRIAPGRSNPPA
jgi:hypothetical protein